MQLREQYSKNPHSGISIFILAMHIYTKDLDFGLNAFTISLEKDQLIQSSSGYKGYEPNKSFISKLNSYLNPRPYLANSYSKISDKEIKLFVECSGEDSTRPVIAERNDKGIWKVKIYINNIPPPSYNGPSYNSTISRL